MPTSDWRTISEVIGMVKELNPKSVLDVGIGFGKWGHLFREYLDVWEGRMEKDDWKTRIDGVEIFSKYINDATRYYYNSIFVTDIMDFIPEKKYDLIFIGDVLEHLEKKEAIELIDKLSKESTLLVTTPNGYYRQSSHFGNRFESHLCGFYTSDFKRWNGDICVVGRIIVALIKCQKK